MPLAQRVRDAGLDNMLHVPVAGDEADPVEVVKAASARLEAALTEIAAAKEEAEGGGEEGRHATGEEVGQMGVEFGDAMKTALDSNAKVMAERQRALQLNGDRIILPTGDDLASKVGIIRSETDAALLFRLLYRAQHYPRTCV